MEQARHVDTPMFVAPKLSCTGGDHMDSQEYRSAIGSLLYVCHTRTGIAFVVHKVSQYTQQPCQAHWSTVKRIFHYLKGTLDYGLWIRTQSDIANLCGFIDADWGSVPDDRRSVSSHCVFLDKHLVTWSSKKQLDVSWLTAEDEYHSLVDATSKILWVKEFLRI
ncbi:secreted RxLR effector protein 161-like [Hibiscus syriacus]|uniref:secreted RxLR effector protein 161-like n=1 Tax=Hibiscus syriacus TaxID=106335 RepID=UPI00192186EC|nr:secreted RxLR effector protein 161-like [Hibiscus syriacus]